MAAAFPPPLHELEAEIMEEVWYHGERTVREVLEALNGRSESKRAYTTVLTVMQRLHSKELLRRERRGRRDVYVPALGRNAYMEARAEAQVDSLVSEFGDIALARFSRRFSQLEPERRRQIRRLAGGD
jgi:predicted transcriptional regulator